MSFPAYGDYKDTGNSFLGEVPEHWHDTKLGFLCRKVGSGKTPKGGAETYVDDGVLFIRSQNVYDEGLRLDDVVYISEEVDEEMGISRVQHGDVLLNITGASLGRTCLVADDIPSANVNQHVCIIRLKDASQREFVAMAMKAFLVKSQIDACQNGAAREGLNFEQIGQLRLVVPPEDEQKAISSFLDVETSKIDGLVTEQRRLIELLKEKRQAVISHAVTKGLDPNAPMKDSGIQWLGEVPEHWEVKRLKHISPTITVGIVVNPSTFATDHGLPFIHGGDIREGLINVKDARKISPEASEQNEKTKLNEGDVLTVRVGATRGTTAVAPPECAGGNCASVMLVRKGNFNSDWLCFAMNDRLIQFQIEIVEYGAAQPQFNIGHAVEFWLPVPRRNEQDAIAEYLTNETVVFDQLTTEAERAIELLQERRTALISAAVTGKIDVRGFAYQETA